MDLKSSEILSIIFLTMTELINQLKTLAEQNQILTTITSGSLVVWLVSNLKNIFFTIKYWITELISFNIHNLYEDTGNQPNNKTAKKQVILNNLVSDARSIWERSVDLNLKEIGYFDETSTVWVQNHISNNWTYGFSLKWFMGKLCAISRTYENNNNKNNVVLNIRVFFARKTKFVKELENKIQNVLKEEIKNKEKKNNLVVVTGLYSASKYKRSVSSIFTNNNEHTDLLDDIRKFIDNKEIYRKLNYPYKYSCLLYGKPGTGKTSSIMAIASELNRRIVYINLATSSMTDLLRSINENNPEESIYVFEDIDATSASVNSNRESDNDDQSGPTVNVDTGMKIAVASLSDILNITDGLISSDGAICMFTTNHIEKLDPAFLRAGRMNKLVEFNYLNQETANRMIKKYLGYELMHLKNDIRPAELQEEILNIMVGKSDKNNMVHKFTE